MINITGLILGIAICIGSVGSYIPQFYNIIKHKSIKGISEMSLVILNIGLMCLTLNSIIFSWDYFTYDQAYKLLPFIQISISWVMVLIYYIIFIIYKFKTFEKRILSGVSYLLAYLIFGIVIISLAIGEKIGGENVKFFHIFANVLGYTSAFCNGIVFIPQIITLYINRSNGNLSFLMFLLQTPGNVIIIVFQAVLYKTALSTWITYVILFIEQSIILTQMTYYYFRDSKDNLMTY